MCNVDLKVQKQRTKRSSKDHGAQIQAVPEESWYYVQESDRHEDFSFEC